MTVLERIRSEFQCLQKQGQYLNGRKDKIRIRVFTKIGAEFKCKEGQVQNSNI